MAKELSLKKQSELLKAFDRAAENPYKTCNDYGLHAEGQRAWILGDDGRWWFVRARGPGDYSFQEGEGAFG